jgi:hypothetical protein
MLYLILLTLYYRRQYDYDFMDYLAIIVKALPRYGLTCIIDAHQDVFSRLTGGSGAPGWVLPVVGLSLATLHATHAAHLHPLALLSSDPPPSVWPSKRTFRLLHWLN